MAQLSLGGLGGIVLAPDVLEEQRGAWCSPPEYTAAATERGPFDVDPFTNPRSTLAAIHKCMLERGDDGFGLDKRDTPGTYYIKRHSGGVARVDCTQCYGGGRVLGADLEPTECHLCCDGGYYAANAETTVWIQPPYDLVLEALAHYGHTRFVALLRLDTSTVWFQLLYAGITEADLANPETRARLTKALKTELAPRPPLCEVVMVPKSDRLEFVPPPGVKASSNPFPHGLYYARAADVTEAVKALCYAWPTPRYPWSEDPLGLGAQLGRRLWRVFEHPVPSARPVTAVHLALVVGTGTADVPACGLPVYPRQSAPLGGLVTACTRCLALSELGS
jgi:hypothetical protein